MTENSFERGQPVERLKFLLPEFFRLIWVSDQAKAVWSARLRQAGKAWATLEWQSVAAGLRRFAVVRSGGEWAAQGLNDESLEADRNGGGSELMVVGRSNLGAFREAWLGQQHGAIGEMLGYPACCVRAFERRYAAGDILDQTWAIAAQTTGKAEALIEIESAGMALGNVFWRWMGLRAIPHLPCSFACPAAGEFGEKLLSLASHQGFEAEAGWLRELVSWPVEWSSLHGIAEVKTNFEIFDENGRDLGEADGALERRAVFGRRSAGRGVSS